MVIVTHGSRFMRNATRARVHKEQLRRRGIRVLAIQQTVSDDPNGHFAEGMFELIDQLESETNGVRTRAGMAENARQGYFNGSRPPFGFCVEKIATSAGPKNKLVIEPGEAELVREVYRHYLAGSGAKSTARHMNQRGLLYRKHLWTRDLVLRVISDSGVVCGCAATPGRNSGRLPSARSSWRVCCAAHAAAIPASSKARASSIRTANPIATKIAAASVAAARKPARATESLSKRWMARS